MMAESDIIFADGALDRADRLRADAPALARYLADPATRVLALWQCRPLFDLGMAVPRLAWLEPAHTLIADSPEPPVFLGLNVCGTAHFAVDASHLAVPGVSEAGILDREVLALSPTLQFMDLRRAMAHLSPGEAGIAAAATGIFEWRRTHRFCASCGGENRACHGGWRFQCRSCGRQHFPRTDPVVIMRVLDGDRVLLGRQDGWPEGMYSLLAGFMEPGETVEQAVRRETLEEAGVQVEEVRYLASQPWPFPASLMIGCLARARTTPITRDPHELEDAFWASRAAVAAALEDRNPDFSAPRRGTIARTMLTAWVEGRLDAANQG